MFSWQWESFKEIIQTYAPTVDDHGPLAGPIRRFTIRRDAHLRLWMETKHLSPPQNHNHITRRVRSGSMMTVSRSELAWDLNLRPSGLALLI